MVMGRNKWGMPVFAITAFIGCFGVNFLCFANYSDESGERANLSVEQLVKEASCYMPSCQHELAVKDLERLADEGDPEALHEVAVINYRNSKTSESVLEALKLFVRAADLGVAEASVNAVRICVERGGGLVGDFSEKCALDYLIKYAVAGHGGAQRTYAALLRSGTLVAEDINEAVNWARKSVATSDSIDNNFELYRCLVKTGKSQSIVEAREILEHLAKRGSLKAMEELGFWYRDGRYVKKDIDIAIRYWESAIMHGSVAANGFLGQLYANEMKGGTDAVDLAKKYLEAAVFKNKDGGAANSLGVVYSSLAVDEEGDNEESSYIKEKAFSFFLVGALLDHPTAMYHLALCYAKGFGVSESRSAAVRWLRNAARLGSEEAREQLKISGLDEYDE